VDFSQPPCQDALLAQELTTEEVRELLERLSATELGGSENATVGGIVEVTGSDPATVGRLLIQIRNERLESLIDEHGDRLDALERSAPVSTQRFVEYPRQPVDSRYKPFNYPATNVDPMSESEVKRGRLHRGLIVTAAVIALLVIVFVESCSKTIVR
jgi:hypothetical protein